MIRISGLQFGYNHRLVLKDVSLTVDAGALCGLFGPNGSGKSTLFRCCLGLLRPKSGRLALAGCELSRLSAGEIARLAAYVPQEAQLPFPFSVKEIVLMGRTPHMGSAVLTLQDRDIAAVREALELVGIAHLAEARFDQLSGGQRQLVLIARALAQQTPILVLDEPTSALDFDNQVRIWRTLGSLTRAGKTVLACSHDPNHVSWFCDRVVLLSEGRVVADGRPETAITEQTLASVYREPCRVAQVGHARVVVPEAVTRLDQTTARTGRPINEAVPAGFRVRDAEEIPQ